ncbi:hypothetical protein, partial [Streptomyces sp. NPDC005877]
GYRAGRLSVRPRFTPDLLNRIHQQLDAAGHHAMAHLAQRSARTQQPHPADHEPARGHHDLEQGQGDLW